MNVTPELREPWAITSEAFKGLIDQSQALMAKSATPVDDTTAVSMRGDVACFHVKGPLFRYSNWFSAAMGTSSYGQLRKDLTRVLENDACKAICWIVDSPGGEVSGCAELAAAIYDARGKKPTAVYVAGTGASAAYWLLSAAGKVYCASTAIIGSVGVITTLYDDSKAMQDAGVKEFELVSSQSPNKSQRPADASYRGRVQSRLDALASVMIGNIAKFRSITENAVIKQFGQGDVFVGQDAVDAGLADAVSDVESVIAGLQARADKAANVVPAFPTQIGANGMENIKTLAEMLGLADSATDPKEQVKALVQFQRDVIAAAGTKSADEAIGKVHAGALAIAERDTLKLALKAQERESIGKEVRATLKDAMKDGRLELGIAASVIPSMIKEERREKVLAAIGKIETQDRKNLLDALCSEGFSRKDRDKIFPFVATLKPKDATPVAKVEPPLSDKNGKKVNMASAEQVKTFGSHYGLKPETIAAYAGVDCVADLPVHQSK